MATNQPAINDEGKIAAGLDTILMQDNQIISFASGLNFDEDFEIEGIRTLGFHGDRFFKSMGYTANITIETYVIREANAEGALQTPGWQTDLSFNLNTNGEYDFTVHDITDVNQILFTMMGVKLSTQSVQFPARGLNTKSTAWRASRIVPGLTSS